MNRLSSYLISAVSLLCSASTALAQDGSDTLRFVSTRIADSLAVADCVERVVARFGYTPFTEVEAVETKFSGRRWRRVEDNGALITELRTWIQVSADSVTVPARIERHNVRATVVSVGVGVLQVATECRRARTPGANEDSMSRTSGLLVRRQP